MSAINLSEDLFLGTAELQRLIDFIDSDGYKKLLVDNSYSFGIIKAGDDSELDNFKVESGTNTGTIKIATNSYALDENGNLIYKEAEDNIAIPDDNQYYWVKIKYEASTIEEGTVSVDNQGNLTGSSTKFTEILRGQPNHPAKIKFTDGSLNTQEYYVQEVISDTSAILLGVFQSESDLHYAVVGTFTPGVEPSESEKYPFQYDSTIDITVADGGLVLETVLNTAPSKTEGEEFYIARVKRNGSTLTIEDKRTEFWRTKGSYELSYIDRTQTNPLIGVESIKYDNRVSTLDHNQIKIGWGMRSSNWVANSELRRITFVSADESGKFKLVSDFTDGDFDGWRIYAADGSYKKIISSVLSGGQINMILDSLDPDDYSSGDELVVVPDVEEIQIRFRQDASGSSIGQVETTFNFPISQGYALMKILVPAYLDEDESEVDLENATYSYNITYRYKTFNQYTEWIILPSDTTNGYYDETSFDNNGILRTDPTDRNRKTYTSHAINGYIEFIVNARSYYQTLIQIARGDKYGFERVDLSDTGNNPVYNVEVGTSKQVIVFEDTNSLDVDWFISLLDGELTQNEFFLIFENTITLNGFHLRVVENYVSTSVYDELIDFDTDLIARAADGNLMLRCTWDGSNWHIFEHISFVDLFGTDPGDIPEIGTALGNSEAVETDASGKLKTVATFNTSRIPSLDASKIDSGTFNVDRIPSLSASKITSGTFSTSRIPNLDASKIDSGTFDTLRIPSLDASIITSGTFNSNRLPTATTIVKGALEVATLNETKALSALDKMVVPGYLGDILGDTLLQVEDIGDWNMDASATVIVTLSSPIAYADFRGIDILIRGDSGYNSVLPLNNAGTGWTAAGRISGVTLSGSDVISITLERQSGSTFDSTFYNSTSYNRGWIVIRYSA